MPAASDAVRGARAYLVRVADTPAPALAAFVARHGPVRAAELVAAGEVPAAVRDETAARRLVNRVEDDFADARRVGAGWSAPRTTSGLPNRSRPCLSTMDASRRCRWHCGCVVPRG